MTNESTILELFYYSVHPDVRRQFKKTFIDYYQIKERQFKNRIESKNMLIQDIEVFHVFTHSIFSSAPRMFQFFPRLKDVKPYEGKHLSLPVAYQLPQNSNVQPFNGVL